MAINQCIKIKVHLQNIYLLENATNLTIDLNFKIKKKILEANGYR